MARDLSVVTNKTVFWDEGCCEALAVAGAGSVHVDRGAFRVQDGQERRKAASGQ